MKTTNKHKGYIGSVEVNFEDNCLRGKILFIRDLVTYEAESPGQLQEEFQAAVDDYLETCEQLGVEPDQPHSGSFNVRIGPDLHYAAAKAAYLEGNTLNEFVRLAVKDRVEKQNTEVVHHHHHYSLQYKSEFFSTERPQAGEFNVHEPIIRYRTKVDQGQTSTR
jgi:predicted HicB family RNase H-like nuclease